MATASIAASCSKVDRRLYQQWFNFIDSDGDGRIIGDEAKTFFSMSKIEDSELKKVWRLSDSKSQGFLGFEEFVVAMQLLSLAQAGLDLIPGLLTATVDAALLKPPVMEGFSLPLVKEEEGLETRSGTLVESPMSPIVSFVSRFLKKTPCETPIDNVTSIADGLKRLYYEKLKPLEVASHYDDFASLPLTNGDFIAKPMVLLLGQCSTGKTTFIKHVLKSNYPGAHIGPDPTTGKFIVVMGGPDERTISGNTAAVQTDLPFNTLSTFGGTFLSNFECSQMAHPLLEQVFFVDTPGVQSGEKENTHRSYDFTGVVKWFAEKCDLIILLFDPHKLDISDDFKHVISSLRGQEDKIRVVLNKADQVDDQQLMRVYGALMWSLAKVVNTPEVKRVYVGSFNEEPVVSQFFRKEQHDLLMELREIPKKCCDRRINDFVKRARAVILHAHIMSQLKKDTPLMMGRDKALLKLINNLDLLFHKVQREHHLPEGDFPNLECFRKILRDYNIGKVKKLKPKLIKAVDEMLMSDIPELIKSFKNPYD